MTAYIDNIIIQGTPEEIQEFIELRESGESLIEYLDSVQSFGDFTGNVSASEGNFTDICTQQRGPHSLDRL